jgi:hypothetical protein
MVRSPISSFSLKRGARGSTLESCRFRLIVKFKMFLLAQLTRETEYQPYSAPGTAEKLHAVVLVVKYKSSLVINTSHLHGKKQTLM